MVVDPFGYRLADAFDRLEVRDAGAGDRAGGTEMQEQGSFAAGADAWDLIKRRLRDLLRPFGAVGADREPVRLVTQSL
jgi:hypothetical protein